MNFVSKFGRKLRKAIATHTLALVIMMGMFAIIGLIFLYQWAGGTEAETSVASCTFKKISYCTDWRANNYAASPWNWESREPKGCETLDPPITKPTQDECKQLM